MKIALQGLFPEELQALCRAAGQPAFRGKQLWQWVQVQGATRWDQMGNLPKELKEKLAASHTPEPAKILKESGDAGGTRKWLVGLDDGEAVETVLIPARDWTTVCLSTQVGCKMGCAFCASGKCGFARNLSAGEISAQFQLVAAAAGRRPDNVGARRITISTSGVVPGIRRLAEEGLQVELSVSLHAPNHELRRQLMPIENKHPLPELLAACVDYTAKTKRFVTFEYVLIRGVNDSLRDAEELAGHLRKFSCRVNLIPLSPVEEFAGEAPPRAAVEAFQRTLENRGVSVTLRDSKGKGVDAACGQLRRRTRAAGA